MNAYIKAENLKIRHTTIGKITVIAPVVTVLLSYFLAGKYFMPDNYNWWYSMVMPVVFAIICGTIIQRDGSMGNRAVVSIPIDLKKVWIAKVMIGIEMLSVSCGIIFICSALSLLVWRGQYTYSISLLDAFTAAVVLVFTTAWQIPFCMLLSQKMGIFLLLIINYILSIAGVILAVTKYWIFFPSAYASRLMIPIIHVLPNGLFAEEGSATFSEELLSSNSIVLGIVIAMLLFIGLTWISAKLFAGREAK